MIRALLIAATAALAFGGGADASNRDGTTTRISLDGFCNVIQLAVYPSRQTGEIQVQTSCETGIGTGLWGKVKGAGKYLVIGENPGTAGVTYQWNFTYPLHSGGAWLLSSSTDGVNFFDLNSGTYTVTATGARIVPVGPPADYRIRK